MQCRHCRRTLEHVFLDLGTSPPSNAYISAENLDKPETVYPLKLFVCDQCWLVQTQDFFKADELFAADYAYFSSVSQSWLAHAARYCYDVTNRLCLNRNSFVIEVACNDGYLLKNFKASGIPCLGIEPTAATARVARALGIDVREEFWSDSYAASVPKADLIIGNNVYAHVPDINDFTRGLKTALKPGGTVTLEFPHVLELIAQTQFDTVYHEHFSYLSLYTVSRIFKAEGLRVFDVDRLSTHGGSLRVYGCHDDDARLITPSVEACLKREEEFGLRHIKVYCGFQARADAVRDGFKKFLHNQKEKRSSVAGYGAAAKGNTLLNYAGITPDLIPYVCDAASSKQGKYLPCSHIPVLPPSVIAERRPDVIVIFPWNIADEIRGILAYTGAWNAQLVTVVPDIKMKAA